MSEPILMDLPGGLRCQVWHDAVEITRAGSKPLVLPDGSIHDNWRIQCPLRASLVDGAEQLIMPEIVVPSPVPHISVDVADLVHDPRVLQAFALIDAVAHDLVTGELQPKLLPENPEVEE
jgi:hypothetical protein